MTILTPFTYLFLTMNQNLNGGGFVQLILCLQGKILVLKKCFVSHSKHIAKFLPVSFAVFTNILCVFLARLAAVFMVHDVEALSGHSIPLEKCSSS